MFEETLIIWGGEFGRTIYSQGGLTHENYGRDHHPRCFTMWMAGGGVRGGRVIGSSDAIGVEPRDRPVTPAEIAASVYHALGIDLNTRLVGPENKPSPLVEAAAVMELFSG